MKKLDDRYPKMTDGRIGAEVLPEVIEVDVIIPGDSPSGIFPVGAISRKGTRLFIHDNATPGGLIVGSPTGRAPYNKSSGKKLLIPHGVTGATSKLATASTTSYYWNEIGRVKLPGTQVVDGATLKIDLAVRMLNYSAADFYTSALIAGQDVVKLVPKIVWDDASFFGTDPANNAFTTGFQTNLFPFILTSARTYEISWRSYREHAVSYDTGTGVLTAAQSADADNLFGYKKTVEASGAVGAYAWKRRDGVVATLSPGDDLEFVVVALMKVATATDVSGYYREIDYDLNMWAE